MLDYYFIFLEILSKFNDFVNSDDCIGKITSTNNLTIKID